MNLIIHFTFHKVIHGNSVTVTCHFPQTFFFTREFDGIPRFAGKRVKGRLAGLTSLPANSVACLVSRVSVLKDVFPSLLLYPRIQWPALFRGQEGFDKNSSMS